MVSKNMKKIKEAPEDEMILAELIAAASAHGLNGCRSALFKTKTGQFLEYFSEHEAICEFTPPSQASSCCVLGALGLSRSLSARLRFGHAAICGNDADQYSSMSCDVDPNFVRQWNIGAAFNIAMEEP